MQNMEKNTQNMEEKSIKGSFWNNKIELSLDLQPENS